LSSCDLSNGERGMGVWIGWDPVLQSYWCCVADYNDTLGKDIYPFIQRGYTSDDVYADPAPLFDVIAPYACAFNRRLVTRMLKWDRLTDSMRSYRFYSEDPDVPVLLGPAGKG
jgi:hypothetical protein